MEFNKCPNWTCESIVNSPDNMVLMGLDISPRFCGIAITDTKRIVAKPLFALRWNKRRYKKFLYQIINLINEYKIQGLVIGLPVNVYDELPQSKNFIKTIGHNLKQLTSIPYFFQEEHYSTVMSTAFLRGNMNSKNIKLRQNEIAACYILQNFLNENKIN
jgi:putative Holliday junction resolvase